MRFLCPKIPLKTCMLLKRRKNIVPLHHQKKPLEMKTLLFLQNLGAGEIIIIALVVLLLFGGKKIPELMHGIGKGVRSFKSGLNEVEKEIESIEEPLKDDKKESK